MNNGHTNSPTACGARFHACHCVLEPHGDDVPHQCAPDPVCGGSWMRHPDDDRGMMRVFRYPSNRPECDGYRPARESFAEAGEEPPTDPPDGEYVLEWDGVLRAPRGGITFLPPPGLGLGLGE